LTIVELLVIVAQVNIAIKRLDDLLIKYIKSLGEFFQKNIFRKTISNLGWLIYYANVVAEYE
jgi:hypothetical protein